MDAVRVCCRLMRGAEGDGRGKGSLRSVMSLVLSCRISNLCLLYLSVAITPECSPSCGPNANCQDAACVCDSGYQGDGFNCTGLFKSQTPFHMSKKLRLISSP